MARRRRHRQPPPGGPPGGHAAADVASADGLTIAWNGADARAWDGWLARAERPALEQSWAYGDGVARVSSHRAERAAVWRAGEDGGPPLALAQAIVWRPLGLAVARLLRGPVFLSEPEPAERDAAFALIAARWRARRGRLLLLSPELPEGADADRAMRRLGKRRMVTGYSSVWLDLRPDETALRGALHPKWRNQLRRAERGRLRVQAGQGGAPLDGLLARHEAQRRKARLRMPSAAQVRAVVEAARDRRGTLVATAQLGSETVAGALFLRHGRAATYHVGWSGPAGRAASAQNLLLWRGLLELKARGVEWLDLGGIDGLSMPGISRFKLGLGGTPFTLAGTYL